MSKYSYDGSEQFRPISAWGYVGYTILFCIPLLGFILLIVFSLSGKNINRRNYARSYFCMLLIAIILSVAIGASTGLFKGSPSDAANLVLSGIKNTIQQYTGVDLPDTKRSSSAGISTGDVGESDDLMVVVKVGGVPLQIHQSFKDAMDKYEAYFDEYVDAKNNNDISKLASVMGKYAETMAAFEKVEDEDMNEAEAAYYTEVQARILKKLEGTEGL